MNSGKRSRGFALGWMSRLAILIAFLVWIGLPLAAWVGWGVDELENYLTVNALPVGLIWNGAVVVALVHLSRRRFARLAIVAALAIPFWTFGYAPLSRALVQTVEDEYPAKNPASFKEPLRAILMLGGCANRLPNGRPQVNCEGQRIVATAEFWHAGKTEWIVTTGKRSEDENDQRDGSLIARDLLVGLGVPEEKILRIAGRNTAEEISSMSDLIESPPAPMADSEGEVGLVTSAFHMPRAMKLAKTQGLDVIPLPSGYRAGHRAWTPSDLVPNAEALHLNSILAREFLARLVGR